jgi:hypothetical protein
MPSLSPETPSSQPLQTNMRHSLIQLLTKTGFTAFILASAQAASAALTITFTANSATFIPNGVPPSGNTRPLQLNDTGNAMNTGATPNTRNFIYQSLQGNYPLASPLTWTPVGQTTSALGEQRFDYYFGNSQSSSTTGGSSGLATVQNWSNSLDLDFGSFYLAGSCTFCGFNNRVSIVNSASMGTAQFIGEAITSSPGVSKGGNQNTLNSSVYNIIFGASMITGTLQYSAFTNVTNDPLTQSSGGIITITAEASDPPNPPAPVPAPLSVLGVGAAFGFSRRLRRRILDQANKSQYV